MVFIAALLGDRIQKNKGELRRKNNVTKDRPHWVGSRSGAAPGAEPTRACKQLEVKGDRLSNGQVCFDLGAWPPVVNVPYSFESELD